MNLGTLKKDQATRRRIRILNKNPEVPYHLTRIQVLSKHAEDIDVDFKCLRPGTEYQVLIIIKPEIQTRYLKGQLVLDSDHPYLKEKKIGCAVYYPRPMHEQACFAPLGHKKGDFPVSEELSTTSLAIPVFPELTTDEQDYVVEQIVAFFK